MSSSHPHWRRGRVCTIIPSLPNTLHKSSTHVGEMTYIFFLSGKKKHKSPISLLLARTVQKAFGIRMLTCLGGCYQKAQPWALEKPTAMLVCFITFLQFVHHIKEQYFPLERKTHPSLWKLYHQKVHRQPQK